MKSFKELREEKEIVDDSGGGGVSFAKVQVVGAHFKIRRGRKGSPHVGRLPGADWFATKHMKNDEKLRKLVVEDEGTTPGVFISYVGFYHTEFVKDGPNTKLIFAITKDDKDGAEYTQYSGIDMELSTFRKPTGEKNPDGTAIWDNVRDENGESIKVSAWIDAVAPALAELFSDDELEEIVGPKMKPFADFAEISPVLYLGLKKVPWNSETGIPFHFLPIARYANEQEMQAAKKAYFDGGGLIQADNADIVYPTEPTKWSNIDWQAKGIPAVQGLATAGQSIEAIAQALEVNVEAVAAVYPEVAF